MNKKPNKLKDEFEDKLRTGNPTEPTAERPLNIEIERDENIRPEDREDYTRTIPVIEEQVSIDKEVVETGRVHISKEVYEEDVNIDLPTVYEEADIERVEINQYVDTPPPPVRYEGDKMIIPVLREVMVVQKKILVVEELHITKRRTEEVDTQQVKLRREEIHVDRDRKGDPDQRNR
jgi:uncharacterized protein (TIGR02271 family)